MALANEKQDVFSFKDIKPSLVFFNQDGESFSIISNNNKNDPDYESLQELWNSNNEKINNIEEFRRKMCFNDLIDYKKMNHDDFLEQIKILFSIDRMELQQLKDLCVNEGNYIFTSDNFIKMVRISLNVEAKIPVGKTKLLEMLTILYGKGKENRNWKKLGIHAGTTDKEIVDFLDKASEEYEKREKKNELLWIFFDEINTCNSLGLIKEIMCNRTYLGKKINENFVFFGACNPYRILTKKMRTSGLVYYNMKETGNKLNNLVYTVNPLPHALLNFVFDFGYLQPEDEKKYIVNTVKSLITTFQKEGIIANIKDNVLENIQKDNILENIQKDIVESIEICHNYIREKYDKSSVSLREIRRFGIFFKYFILYFDNIIKKKESFKYNTLLMEKNPSIIQKLKSSLNITLYLCYYLRLNDKKYREILAEKLNKFFEGNNFLRFPENEIKRITLEMSIEKGKGIALNRALRENLFTCFICIDNNIPLIIVGKPGTGKSLSFQILYNTLKGEYSESPMFRDKGKLYRYYYQGSETSTSEGIKKLFEKAIISREKNKDNNII